MCPACIANAAVMAAGAGSAGGILALFIVPDTLPTAGAEGKALQGRNLSADSGADIKLGFGEELNLSSKLSRWDRHQRDNSQGSGDRVPGECHSFRIDSFRLFRSFSSDLSPDPCLRP